MEWENFIDESEEFKAKFEYISMTKKVSVLAATNKRVFIFKKSHNDYKFVSSHKSISQIEYGVWKMKYWQWTLVIVSFLLSLESVIIDFNAISFIFFLPPLATLILCIIYRKYEYINTAVGCEPFRVTSIRRSIRVKIEEFINILHSETSNLRLSPERYVQSFNLDIFIKRIITFSSISEIIIIILIF